MFCTDDMKGDYARTKGRCAVTMPPADVSASIIDH
jgi:hypothetical protein